MTELAAAGRLVDAIEIGAEGIQPSTHLATGHKSAISTAIISVRPATRGEPSPPAWSRSVTAHHPDGSGRYSMTPTRPDKLHRWQCWPALLVPKRTPTRGPSRLTSGTPAVARCCPGVVKHFMARSEDSWRTHSRQLLGSNSASTAGA